MIIKDHEPGPHPPNGTAPAQAAPEESCLAQHNRPPRKLPSRSLQLADLARSTVLTDQLSKGCITRVLARLRDGESEQWVSRKEEVTLEQVREIRRSYFAIVERAVAIVRMEHENAAELIAELEQDVLEQECA